MNPHRDNFLGRDIISVLAGDCLSEMGHPSAGAENSQIVGSNVIVYSEGDTPQTFSLRFPSRHDFLQSRDKYELIPSFQFQCGKGTVSILDPLDDLLMTHDVCFHQTGNKDCIGYRIGFCLRWLQSERDFYVHTCGMRMDSNALEVVKTRTNYVRAENCYPKNIKHIRT